MLTSAASHRSLLADALFRLLNVAASSIAHDAWQPTSALVDWVWLNPATFRSTSVTARAADLPR